MTKRRNDVSDRVPGSPMWAVLGVLAAGCGGGTQPGADAALAEAGGHSSSETPHSGGSGGSSAAASGGSGAIQSIASNAGGTTAPLTSASGGALAIGGSSTLAASSASGGLGATGGTAATTQTQTGGSSAGVTGGSAGTGGSQALGGAAALGGSNSAGSSSAPQATGGTLATGGSKPFVTGGSAAAGGTAATGGSTSTSTGTTLCPGASQVLTVSAKGDGQYKTIQSAVNSVPTNNAKLVQITVRAGTYAEQVTIDRPFICLVGEGATTTKITHAAGTSIVTGGTVIVTGSDFSAANIAFENTGGDGSGQAVALMAKGNRQQFYNCRFLSYQDTLYTNVGTQYFRNCYIQGDTDYIFGDATAVFENCTMNNVAEGTAVTAPRTPQNTKFGLVFLGGSLTANPTTSTVRSNHVYLGRPWGPYGAAAFLRVEIGSHINSAGWTTMSNNDLSQVRFFEYKSTGPGANPTNPTRSGRQLSDTEAATYTVKNILQPWVPSYSGG